MVENKLQSNYQSFFNSFEGIINGKIRVPNAPFLKLIFCKFLDHELKTYENLNELKND